MAQKSLGLGVDFGTRWILTGVEANQALREGAEGRFMRAVKRILGIGRIAPAMKLRMAARVLRSRPARTGRIAFH